MITKLMFGVWVQCSLSYWRVIHPLKKQRPKTNWRSKLRKTLSAFQKSWVFLLSVSDSLQAHYNTRENWDHNGMSCLDMHFWHVKMSVWTSLSKNRRKLMILFQKNWCIGMILNSKSSNWYLSLLWMRHWIQMKKKNSEPLSNAKSSI
jgi:hypothetical protein